jgi:hypothetical protein
VIVDVILSAVTALVVAVLNLIPDYTLPSWLENLPATAAAFGASLGGYGNWIPWSSLLQVVGAVFTVVVLVVGARLALWLWSKVPFLGSP